MDRVDEILVAPISGWMNPKALWLFNDFATPIFIGRPFQTSVLSPSAGAEIKVSERVGDYSGLEI